MNLNLYNHRDDLDLLDFSVETQIARIAAQMFESNPYRDWNAVQARLLAVIPRIIAGLREELDPSIGAECINFYL